MVTKVHVDGENHRRLIVLGRDIAFWIPAEPEPEEFLVDELVEETV